MEIEIEMKNSVNEWQKEREKGGDDERKERKEKRGTNLDASCI